MRNHLAGVPYVTAKRPGVQEAWLFGSAARGDGQFGSDIDLLIRWETYDKDIFDWLDLQSELEQMLGCEVSMTDVDSLYRCS
jgi:predicted nucleotidyltransferase